MVLTTLTVDKRRHKTNAFKVYHNVRLVPSCYQSSRHCMQKTICLPRLFYTALERLLSGHG